ncbi:MAG: hypothetical protein LBP33_05125 [Candidatus Adiutrix sp.]|jgi:hypothetical protein|nr:hypothetical protein [Candidatus Adiutrix sp.]
MFNLFILAVLFGLIFWIVRDYGRRTDSDRNQTQDLVCDALSGVYFPKNEAVSITRGGETLYFLSIENRDKFLSLNR